MLGGILLGVIGDSGEGLHLFPAGGRYRVCGADRGASLGKPTGIFERRSRRKYKEGDEDEKVKQSIKAASLPTEL